MNFAVIIEYGPDKEKVKSLHLTHREYLRQYLENGRLRAAGPFAEDAGALWVLDTETAEQADDIVRGDPYIAAGAIASWKIRPFAYWSAQTAKGAR